MASPVKKWGAGCQLAVDSGQSSVASNGPWLWFLFIHRLCAGKGKLSATKTGGSTGCYQLKKRNGELPFRFDVLLVELALLDRDAY
jgi:hypothetical protein